MPEKRTADRMIPSVLAHAKGCTPATVQRVLVHSLAFALYASSCTAQQPAQTSALPSAATQQVPPVAAAPSAAPNPSTPAAPTTSEPIAYDREPLPTDPAAALLLASKANALDWDELRPWYLKAHYQAYDAKGLPAQAGTFEVFWLDKDHHRVSYVSSAFTRDVYHTPEGDFYVGGANRLPYTESLLWDQIVHPVKLLHISATPRLIKEKIGNIPMTCIHIPIAGAAEESYCLDQQRPVLRAFQEGGYGGIFNKPMIFQHHFLAGESSIFDGQQQVITISVDNARGLRSTDAAALVPPAGSMKREGANFYDPSQNVVSSKEDALKGGNAVSKAQPIYPAEAKQRRAQGTVRIWATIGEDGTVHDPVVVRDPDAALSEAALKAVSQWRYAPYTSHGRPVRVDMSINVIFVLGG